MRLSLMKAITLSIRLSFHDSYELVTRDELVVVAESDDPGPRGRFGVRALDFVRVDGHHVLVDCGLRLGWPRPVYAYLKHRGGDLRGRGCGSLALPVRPGRQWCVFFANCWVRAGGTA